MSDLEEEDRCHSDWAESAEWSDNQIGILLDCEADRLKQARRLYETIQIPGELNTRVRAAIESEQKRRKYGFLRLFGIAAVLAAGMCCIIFYTGTSGRTENEINREK